MAGGRTGAATLTSSTRHCVRTLWSVSSVSGPRHRVRGSEDLGIPARGLFIDCGQLLLQPTPRRQPPVGRSRSLIRGGGAVAVEHLAAAPPGDAHEVGL